MPCSAPRSDNRRPRCRALRPPTTGTTPAVDQFGDMPQLLRDAESDQRPQNRPSRTSGAGRHDDRP
jgi:hypothetical protein